MVQPALGWAVVGVQLALMVLITVCAVLGPDERVERVYRLLRWIANRPEPTAPRRSRKQPSSSPATTLSTSNSASLETFLRNNSAGSDSRRRVTVYTVDKSTNGDPRQPEQSPTAPKAPGPTRS